MKAKLMALLMTAAFVGGALASYAHADEVYRNDGYTRYHHAKHPVWHKITHPKEWWRHHENRR